MYEGLQTISDLWWRWLWLCLPGGLLLYFAVEIVQRYGKKFPPSLRYWLLNAVLLNFVIPAPWHLQVPVQTLWFSSETVTKRLGYESFTQPKHTERKANETANRNTIAASWPNITSEYEFAVPGPLESSEPGTESNPRTQQTVLVWLGKLEISEWLFAAFVFGLLAVCGSLAVKVGRLLWIHFHAGTDEELTHQCERLCVRMDLRMPRIWISESIPGPVAGGLFMPYVLMPATYRNLSAESQELLLLHELAHLKFRDPLVNWIQLFIGVLYWWNPCVHRLNHLIRCEREHRCDDFVLHLHPAGADAYPRVLLDAAEEQVRCRQQALVSAFAYPHHALSERIRRLAMKTKPQTSIWMVASLTILFCVPLFLGVDAVRADSEGENTKDSQSGTSISEKTYTESTSEAVGNVPGVARSVQNAGIGSGGSSNAGTTITETITNYTATKKDAKSVATNNQNSMTTASVGVMSGSGGSGQYGASMSSSTGQISGGYGMGMGMGGMGMGGAGMMDGMGMSGMGMMGGMGPMSLQTFAMQLLNGGEIKLLNAEPFYFDAEEKNKPSQAVLYAWATWCPPCWEELALLNELQDTFAKHGIYCIAVNVTDTQKQVLDYIKETGLTLPMAVNADDERNLNPAQNAGGLRQMRTVVVNAKGPFSVVKSEQPQQMIVDLLAQLRIPQSEVQQSDKIAQLLRENNISSAKNSMRTLATALQTFYADNNEFPTPYEGARTIERASADDKNIFYPVAYLSNVLADPYDPDGKPFRYFSDGNTWVLVSNGPDGKPDYDERTMQSGLNQDFYQQVISPIAKAGNETFCRVFRFDKPEDFDDSSKDFTWESKLKSVHTAITKALGYGNDPYKRRQIILETDKSCLVVFDTRENLKKIDKIIASLDLSSADEARIDESLLAQEQGGMETLSDLEPYVCDPAKGPDSSGDIIMFGWPGGCRLLGKSGEEGIVSSKKTLFKEDANR